MKFDPRKIDEGRGNMSLRELAAKINVTEQTLKNWRRGRTSPTVRDLGRLAATLRKSVGFFFDKAA
jgi:transcriptional regulator with XRE-family HTH domain